MWLYRELKVRHFPSSMRERDQKGAASDVADPRQVTNFDFVWCRRIDMARIKASSAPARQEIMSINSRLRRSPPVDVVT